MGNIPTREHPIGSVNRPYDSEVVYLTTKDQKGVGAYLDSGLTYNDLGKNDFAIEFTNSLTLNFGVTRPGNVESMWLGFSGSSSKMSVMFGRYAKTVQDVPELKTRQDSVIFDAKEGVYVNGVQVVSNSVSSSHVNGNLKVIFFNQLDLTAGKPRSYWHIGSCGGIKICRKSTGEILRDFIPVRLGKKGYYFDREHPDAGLYGGNTADFVLGSDKR